MQAILKATTALLGLVRKQSFRFLKPLHLLIFLKPRVS